MGCPYPVALMSASGVTVQAMMTPVRGIHDGLDMLALRDALVSRGATDWAADALDVVAARCLAAGERQNRTAEVSVADVLRARSLDEKKAGPAWRHRQGGWRPHQTEPARLALLQVASYRLMVRGSDPAGKEIEVDGAAFEFESVGDGRYRVRVGEAIQRYLGGRGASAQIEMLDARILSLPPRAEAVAKRLGRYFADQWRIKAKRAERGATSMSGPWAIKILLNAAGMEIDDHDPSRTRARLMRALGVLEERGITGEVVAEHERPVKRRGWVEAWLRSTISVAPPPEVEETYRRIFSGDKPLLEVVQGERSRRPLNVRMRERRRELGWRQRQLAELLCVRQDTITRIEQGRKVRLSDEQQARLQGWLEGEGDAS